MNRRPFNLNRAFGVELEFIAGPNVSRHDIARAIGQKFEEIDSDGTRRWNIISGTWSRNAGYRDNGWYMKTDSTAGATSSQQSRGLSGGNELVSPKLMGKDGFTQLAVVLEVMNELGCEVSKNCGLHIHHDLTDVKDLTSSYNPALIKRAGKTLVNLIMMVARWEKYIYMLLPKSRRPRSMGAGCGSKNGWCASVNAQMDTGLTADFNSGVPVARQNITRRIRRVTRSFRDRRPSMFQFTRTCGLNFYKFWIYGTVEFRYGGGSLNFEKISNWVVFTQAFVNTAKDIDSIPYLYDAHNADYMNKNKAIAWMKRNLGLIGETASNPVQQRYLDATTSEYTVDEDGTYAHKLVATASKWVNKRIRDLERAERTSS